MNDQKSLIKVLCIVIVILGFMIFSQQRQIETLRQDINILGSNNDQEHRNIESTLNKVKSKVDDLENKLDDIEGNVNNMGTD